MRKEVKNMKRTSRLPSPALVVSLVALFVALSGGAAAATVVASHEGATTHAARAQLAARAGTLTRRLVLSSSNRSGRIQSSCCRGPRGLRGPRGPRGFRGANGGFTTANVTYVDGPVAHLCQLGAGSCAVGVSVAACPAGKVAIGGGWMGDTPDPPVAATVAANAAANDKTGWGVVMVNDTDALTASYHAFVACAG
jgi:hypothetical protein